MHKFLHWFFNYSYLKQKRDEVIYLAEAIKTMNQPNIIEHVANYLADREHISDIKDLRDRVLPKYRTLAYYAIKGLLETMPELDSTDPVGNQLKRAAWTKELEKVSRHS